MVTAPLINPGQVELRRSARRRIRRCSDGISIRTDHRCAADRAKGSAERRVTRTSSQEIKQKQARAEEQAVVLSADKDCATKRARMMDMLRRTGQEVGLLAKPRSRDLRRHRRRHRPRAKDRARPCGRDARGSVLLLVFGVAWQRRHSEPAAVVRPVEQPGAAEAGSRAAA